MDHHHFRLYANCIPVNGISRNTICDMQRSEIIYTSHFQHNLITLYKNLSLKELEVEIGSEKMEEANKFFALLVKKEIGMWCNNPSLFPEISKKWDVPSFITNCIVDFDSDTDFNFDSLVKQLDDLGCQALQLRFYTQRDLSEIDHLLQSLEHSRIYCIEIITPDYPSLNLKQLEKLCWKHRRIRTVHLHSSDVTEACQLDAELKLNVTKSEIPINSHSHCGFIDPSQFVLNSATFFEGQRHNTCLNRKIGIDKDGNVKNCPSMERSFGHIDEVKLREVIESSAFTELWYVNKDQIETCMDCEFRYVCADCRAFLDKSVILTAKPKKCNYNPKTTKWES